MLETLFQTYQGVGDGLRVIQLIGADFNGMFPSLRDLRNWIDYIHTEYGVWLTFAVAQDPFFNIGDQYNPTGYIPYYWMIDQSKVIYWKNAYLSTFETKIQELLSWQ